MSIVIDDGTDLSIEIVLQLKILDIEPIIVSFFSTYDSSRFEGFTYFTVTDQKEENLKQFLHDISKTNDILGLVYPFTATASDLSQGKIFSELEYQELEGAFLFAKLISKRLNDGKGGGFRKFFFTITRMDGFLGLGNTPDSPLMQGGVNGLVKTLSLEWPHIYCKTLDFSSDYELGSISEKFIQELYDADLRWKEIGYSQEGRTTLISGDLIEWEKQKNHDFWKSNPVVIVTGGARGVTAECIINLAQYAQCTFLLLGRTSLDFPNISGLSIEDDTAELKKKIMQYFISQGQKTTPKEVGSLCHKFKAIYEVKENLSKLESLGSKAEYIPLDVNNAKLVKETIHSLSEKFGAITAVIHGAGVLADKPIERKTLEDFSSVLSTKVAGLQNVLAAIDNTKLRALALFSSAAGFYGNSGQSDYSIANEVMNKISWQIKQTNPACLVSSFNWGPWDGGMVTPELKRFFEQRNVDIIPIEEGSQIFSNVMLSENPYRQVLVGSSMLVERTWKDNNLVKSQLKSSISLNDNLSLQDHSIQNTPVLPLTMAFAWMVESTQKRYPEYKLIQASKIQVLKGILFEDESEKELFTEIEEKERSDQEVVLQVKVYSKNEKRIVYHYSSNLLFGKVRAITPSITLPELGESIFGQHYYKNKTLFHGSQFQGISKVWNISKDEVVAQCILDGEALQKIDSFSGNTLNGIQLDQTLQLMLVWVKENTEMGSLPLQIGFFKKYKDLNLGDEFYLHLKSKLKQDHQYSAQMDVVSKNGDVYFSLDDIEVTISKALAEKFK